MEKEAMLCETLLGGRVRCHVCQWRCLINPGKLGVWRMRINRDGKIFAMNYAEVSSMAPDHIEKKPLFHFFPGTYAFSLGGWGCNFHCKGCQNWEISCTDIPRGSQQLLPEREIELTKNHHCQGILEVARRAKEKWHMHVEVVTNIIPTMNDDEEQLRNIATWIRDDLGEFTPWHVTRFHPLHEFTQLSATLLATLEKAYQIGKGAGLRFVYLGNVPGHDYENTMCYSCGKMVVHRIGYDTEGVGLDGSECKFCGAELNFRI